MISHYLSLATRKLSKNRSFTLINVLGLSASMAAFIFISQYIAFERSYNGFHKNINELYRVVGIGEDSKWSAYSAPGFAPMAAGSIAGVEDYCRIAEGANLGTGVVRYVDRSSTNDRSFRETNFAYIDGNFFGFFSFKVWSGSATRMTEPNTVAISKAAAARYFGDSDPIGNTLTLSNQFGQTDYSVAMVFEDMPDYSDLHYDLLFSLKTLANPDNLGGNEGWASTDGTGSQWLFTYLRLKRGSDSERIAEEYRAMISTKQPDFKGTVALQPMASMHLGRSMSETLPTFGSLRFIYLLTVIAAMILIVAWFNYVNLSTAGALRRAKEVGISKALGASKGQLVRQFLSESALLNALAVVVAVALVGIFQAPYDALLGRANTDAILSSPEFWTVTGGILFSGTVIFGIYTSILLTSFEPSGVLRGGFSVSQKGGTLRKSLVVVQFVVSAVLFISTLVVYQQLRYMKEIDLGMQTSSLLVVHGADVNKDETFNERRVSFEDQIAKAAFVQEFSKSGNVPMEGYNFSTSGIARRNAMPLEQEVSYNILSIDENFLSTYGIALAAGSNFTVQDCEKGWKGLSHVIMNESAARAMGFDKPDRAVGEHIVWGDREIKVKGIVKDYHHQSAQYKIEPIILLPSLNSSYYTLKLSRGPVSEQLATLERVFKASFPGNPFEYTFLDESLKAQYNVEQRYSVVFTIAASLAILIGCLGLFGLSKHNVDQRVKEIGIRKVLGSSVLQIVNLVSRDFIWLVAGAFILGVPLATWLVDRWLSGFAYRVSMHWWIFASSAAVIIVVAWGTVAIQAYRGATTNPVESLKNE